jgi:thioredoxin-related protein
MPARIERMRPMKRFVLVLLLAFAGEAFAGGDKGTELQWKPFVNGFAEAKKMKKKVMLDVYTDWCGWCKRLDKDVYGNAKVAEYLNDHYVVIKLNAESSKVITYLDTNYTERDFARYLGVRGYPTIIFFENSGEPITPLSGYVAAEKFLPIIKFIGEDFYKTMDFEKFSQEYAKQEEKK